MTIKKTTYYKLLILFIVPLFSGCISLYYKYEKTPCNELGPDVKENIKKIILNMGFKEKDLILTDSSVQYTRKKVVVFKEISKVVVATKTLPKGKRYTLITIMKNREKHVFATYDYKLAINVYSALECYAGIKPKNQPPPPTDKYERLGKLKALLDSGALTNEEYEKEKKKILEEEN